MSAVSLTKAPSFERVQTPEPEVLPEKAMAKTIKAINVLVLDQPFAPLRTIASPFFPGGVEELDFWSPPQEVRFSKDKSLPIKTFKELFASQDVVLIPCRRGDTSELLEQLGVPHTRYYISGQPSLIALNPKTWQPHPTHIVTSAPALTILAQQRDGRQVLLSCGQFEDEQTFAKHVHTLHRKQQLSNKEAEYPQGWTETIAAFDTPISRKRVLSTCVAWQWSSKIPSTDDVAIAKNILGTSWHLDENPLCAEGLIQRQITWPSASDEEVQTPEAAVALPSTAAKRLHWNIKRIYAMVLPKLQISFPWDKRGNGADAENNTMTKAAFKELVSSLDVVFIPNPSAKERLVLAMSGFEVEAVALEPSIIGLNRKTWNPDAELLTTTNRLEVMPHGITILATQKDGRPVLLSCYKFETESAFATQMQWQHEKWQSLNVKHMEERGWMHAIAAFDTPLSRECFPSHSVSAHWQWSSKIPDVSDVAKAKQVLGTTWFLDENPQCAEGLIQRQITWPSETDEDIYS
jgi:hypothetical protein